MDHGRGPHDRSVVDAFAHRVNDRPINAIDRVVHFDRSSAIDRSIDRSTRLHRSRVSSIDRSTATRTRRAASSRAFRPIRRARDTSRRTLSFGDAIERQIDDRTSRSTSRSKSQSRGRSRARLPVSFHDAHRASLFASLFEFDRIDRVDDGRVVNRRERERERHWIIIVRPRERYTVF